MPAQLLLKGRGLVECPRWHKGELWFADWTTGEIRVLEEKGQSRLVVPAKAPPLSFDFSPDNELFVVQSASSSLLRFDGEGLKEFAALGPGRWNEIVIDAAGRIYVNGPSLMLILRGMAASRRRLKAFSFRTAWRYPRMAELSSAPKVGPGN
ncbi:SMP-30/gluconolactonase/LRE family protein [Rhizobium phaseoli]|uniref:SMP-30/gluconolactonase/LRE family protein n=1 Tax=Rhizobium phaseoli TaxID=396 RepID=UPI000ABB00A0